MNWYLDTPLTSTDPCDLCFPPAVDNDDALLFMEENGTGVSNHSSYLV